MSYPLSMLVFPAGTAAVRSRRGLPVRRASSSNACLIVYRGTAKVILYILSTSLPLVQITTTLDPSLIYVGLFDEDIIPTNWFIQWNRIRSIPISLFFLISLFWQYSSSFSSDFLRSSLEMIVIESEKLN